MKYNGLWPLETAQHITGQERGPFSQLHPLKKSGAGGNETWTDELTRFVEKEDTFYSKGGGENTFSRTQVKSKSHLHNKHIMLRTHYTTSYQGFVMNITLVSSFGEKWCSSDYFCLCISLFMFRWRLRDFKQYCIDSFDWTLSCVSE